MQQKNVLILGATGTTGREALRATLAAGAAVRAATRSPEKANVPAGATAVRWDYDDASTWAPALAGVDALYMVLPPFRPDEAELGGAVVNAAKAAGVKRIVKLSALGADAHEGSGLRAVELAIEQSGLDWIHLRPSFFTDNFVNFYGHGIRSDGVIALAAGQGKTGFVAASDIGDMAAVALLADRTNEAWALTGPEELDHDEVAGILSEVLDRPIRYLDLAPADFAAGMEAAGMPPTAVATMSWLYDGVRSEQWATGVSPCIRKVLGREPVSVRAWAEAHRSAWT